MPRHAMTALLLALTLLPGCGGGLPDPESIDSHEEAAEAGLEIMTELAETLEGVKDAGDAEAAADRIVEITGSIEALAEKLQELPAPSEAEMKTIAEDFEPKMRPISERIKKAGERIASDEAMREALGDTMRDMSFALMKLDIDTQEDLARRAERERRRNQDRSEPPNARHPQAPAGSDMPIAFRSLVSRFGEEKVVMIILNDAPPSGPAPLMSQLRPAIGSAQIIPAVQHQTNQIHFYIAPIDDLRALANHIPFGRVDSIDDRKRVITVEYQQQ